MQVRTGRAVLIAGMGGLLLAAAVWIGPWAVVVLLLAMVLVALAFGPVVQRRRMQHAIERGLEGSLDQFLLSDEQGRILYRNPSARLDPLLRDAPDLATALAEDFADPPQLLAAMFANLRRHGHAREDHITRTIPVLLTATDLGQGFIVWRRIGKSGSAHLWPREDDPIPMARRTADGTYASVNAALRRLLGLPEAEAITRLAALDLSIGLRQLVPTAHGTQEFLVMELPAACGREVLFLPPAQTSAAGAWDLPEDFPVAILKLTRDGLVIGSNREARALLPMPFGPETRFSEMVEGLGRPIIDWLRETHSNHASAAPQFLRGTHPYQDFFLRVALHPVGQGRDAHILAVLSDMTEMKSLEAQFVQSQKMQAIGQLAGGVAHDFNNLLTAISGHCDLMLLRRDRTDPDYPDLTQIHQNANRAASLVGQLLAFSRKQSLMPEVLDMRDTLADLTHLLNRLVGERVRLHLDHDPDLKPVRADKRQLEQVIMNLVVNARDAMPQGGDIRVETEAVHLRSPLSRDRATLPAGHYVVVRVIDSGHGIPPDRINKIFEPFYTTKRPGEGTGLGLSTAYGIVKQTGGYIFVDSELDRGTCFTLYLPASDAPLIPPAPVVEASAPPALREGVVLLVEDEAPVRAFASRALALRGFNVIEADCAEVALDILTDSALHVDLIVTDVIMPGLDGPTWVREALKQRPETRVIFMSGYAEDAFAEQKEMIPHSVFLPKPFSLAELTAVVEGEMQ